jgi:urease accessory protein
MRRTALLTALIAAAATPALAHVGYHAESGFAAGVAHPLTGLDHLLAMVGVGLWAGLACPRKAWLWPAAFVVFMLAGFALGRGVTDLPGAEAVIGFSVVALGAAVAARLMPPALVGAGVVAVFALAHGYAHGQEAPGDASALSFAAGFSLSTIALHLAGLGLALGLARFKAPLARIAGAGVAAAGVALALAG